MDEDDVFAARRHAHEQWDDALYRAEQLAGALQETTCPNCHMRIGGLIINGPDSGWVEIECPACAHRFEEDT